MSGSPSRPTHFTVARVAETKYTYRIIRRRINDELSRWSAQNSPHARPSYPEGRRALLGPRFRKLTFSLRLEHHQFTEQTNPPRRISY